MGENPNYNKVKKICAQNKLEFRGHCLNDQSSTREIIINENQIWNFNFHLHMQLRLKFPLTITLLLFSSSLTMLFYQKENNFEATKQVTDLASTKKMHQKKFYDGNLKTKNLQLFRSRLKFLRPLTAARSRIQICDAPFLPESRKNFAIWWNWSIRLTT